MTEYADLIGSADAADILGIDRRRFNRWVTRGRIPVAIQMGSNTAARLFSRAEIEALAKQVAA